MYNLTISCICALTCAGRVSQCNSMQTVMTSVRSCWVRVVHLVKYIKERLILNEFSCSLNLIGIVLGDLNCPEHS